MSVSTKLVPADDYNQHSSTFVGISFKPVKLPNMLQKKDTNHEMSGILTGNYRRTNTEEPGVYRTSIFSEKSIILTTFFRMTYHCQRR